jgi:hypothetical protein
LAWGKARDAVVSMAASDEGDFMHVAESAGVEVFDSVGKPQRTLGLGASRAPMAIAAVPAGSSLYLGAGAQQSAPAAVGTPGALVTQKPPPTGTLAGTAQDVAGYPPFQGAAAVAVAILLVYWLIARWYEKRIKSARSGDGGRRVSTPEVSPIGRRRWRAAPGTGLGRWPSDRPSVRG